MADPLEIPESSAYVRSDGALVIPAAHVPGALSLLTYGVNALLKDGFYPKTEMNKVLAAAQQAAREEDAIDRMSVVGRLAGRSGKVDIAEILTVSEAAARRGCSTREIRRACTQGRLRAEKLGNQWVITSRDFDIYRYGENHA